MNVLKLGLAVAAATMIGTAAQAGTIIHDTEAEFSAIVYTEGANSSGGGVADNRDDPFRMFDNDNSTILSLGLGGTLSATIDPTSYSITSGSVIELTNIGSDHEEIAELWLGVEGGSSILIGTLLNNALGGSTTTVDPSIASLSAVIDGANTIYTLTVASGSYNQLTLVDVSPDSGSNRDGFDIAELSVTSVPEPATLALLGAGLLGLGALARRKAA